MLQRTLAFAAALLACSGAQAASDPELAANLGELRAQIEEMKKSYEQRIAALEARLAAAEAVPPASAPPAPSQPASGATAFNPEISVILNGTYASTSQSPDTYRLRGFIPSGGDIRPPRRSFSLGESELALSANVDHLFRGTALFSVAPDGGIDTEEAYIETLALPAGLKLKAGRFLSGIGYLNAQHPHAWDFVDAPLAYKAFYGSRLDNDGVQLKWLAPTPIFLEFGAELARGGNFPGNERNRNGSGLGTLFAHVGDDVGISHSWQAGVSYVSTHPNGRTTTDEVDGIDYSFTGRSQTLGADLVWKWAPNGDSTNRSFKFQTEYLQRTDDGDLTVDATGPASYHRRQSGWYAQGVWQFVRGWRVGYRYDALTSGTADLGPALANADVAGLQHYSPRRNSLMVDWSPSEFSRVRLQYARDTSRGPGLEDNQFFVQYIMSLGAHGAHKF